jgi:putative SOS response-associated peptidase YedK
MPQCQAPCGVHRVGPRVQTVSMCGRFANDAKVDEMIQEFVAEGGDYRDWKPQYSIAPTEVIPIVRERQNKETGEITRSVDPAVWNFHPSFMKESKRPQFNTRIETVATNGLWKGAFASSRCLVPMRGYYEWTGEPGQKQAFFLHGTQPMLAAAGIYTARKVGDEWEVSTSIITREARDASGEVHDRMPVFLDRDAWDDYLAPVKLDDAGKAEMIELMTAESERVASSISNYEVDRRVNNSRAVDPADPTLIEPLD